MAGIKAQTGYKRRNVSYGGKLSIAVDKTLAGPFEVGTPDRVWVTDITYIKTSEGFAYLAVVIDLYLRKAVGWEMQNRPTKDMVLQALLMAVWRRKPTTTALIHSPSPQLPVGQWTKAHSSPAWTGPRFASNTILNTP